MKSFLKIILVSLTFLGIVFGQANMANTKHDLTYSSNTYYSADTDQICVFCHTPHKAASNDLLWQRSVPFSVSFTMFEAGSQTADSLEYESRACLSCHDGSTAFNTLANAPGSGGLNSSVTMNGGNDQISAGATNLGQDLRDDHPVGVVLPTGTGWNTPTSALLYGTGNDQVECASCHNPHEGTNTMFLRASNAASALCIDCHDK
ncbi:cytochrome c3 family protein [Candidatus Neomarinimicrobiota bacterium]